MKNYILSLFLLSVIATQASDRKSAAGALAVVAALQFIKAGDAQEGDKKELTAKQVLQQLAHSGTTSTGKPSGKRFFRNHSVAGKRQSRRNHHFPKQ